MLNGEKFLLEQILKTIADFRIGDISSIVGLFISVIGFAVTIWGVIKSKNAAESTKETAEKMQKDLRRLDTIVDISSVVGIMEEIKRHHRNNNWIILPDRYSSLRGKLVLIKSTHNDLTDKQKTFLQSAIQQSKLIEENVEKALSKNLEPQNFAKLNKLLSDEIDKLNEVMAEIKNQMELEKYG